MKQLGKGCSKCSSLAMLWGLGGSREGETDYHFIKASSDCMRVCGLRMKMPPGQWKKWETIWLLFRGDYKCKNFSPWQNRGQFLFYSYFCRSASYYPTAQTVVFLHEKLEWKNYFQNTSREDEDRNRSPRHRLNTDEVTAKYDAEVASE